MKVVDKETGQERDPWKPGDPLFTKEELDAAERKRRTCPVCGHICPDTNTLGKAS